MRVNWPQFLLNLVIALGALSALIWLGGCSRYVTQDKCAEACADMTIELMMGVCPEQTESFIDEILKSEREGSI